MNRTSKQNINKEILDLNHFRPNGPNRHIPNILIVAESTFSSSARGTFSKTDHMTGHKTCLSKLRLIIVKLY